MSSSLLTGCGEAGPAAGPVPHPAPAVLEVVRHYAGQLAQGTRLTTTASRRFADSVAYLGPNNSLAIDLGTCAMQGWVDSLHRLTSVHILAPYAQYPRDVSLARPNPHLLVRLGVLRRAFGPGTIEQDPPLTKLEGTRCYPVVFYYRPAPSRQVELRACVPTADYADSARVNSLSLYLRP